MKTSLRSSPASSSSSILFHPFLPFLRFLPPPCLVDLIRLLAQEVQAIRTDPEHAEESPPQDKITAQNAPEDSQVPSSSNFLLLLLLLLLRFPLILLVLPLLNSLCMQTVNKKRTAAEIQGDVSFVCPPLCSDFTQTTTQPRPGLRGRRRHRSCSEMGKQRGGQAQEATAPFHEQLSPSSSPPVLHQQVQR
mmetsp:Transcript_21505/g.48721  ORF Transcript_21505/g.48721 Transcript_21505/m.48721 type:complete len:191 (+) Transcript_21505:51-623(+)